MDKIHIKDLALQCIIGTKPEERKQKQEIIINITLECDLVPAGRSDELEDTINYNTLKKEIVALIEGSEFFLLERLADRIAGLCLENDRVEAVTVMVNKPGALTEARSVAVEIYRKNQ